MPFPTISKFHTRRQPWWRLVSFVPKYLLNCPLFECRSAVRIRPVRLDKIGPRTPMTCFVACEAHVHRRTRGGGGGGAPPPPPQCLTLQGKEGNCPPPKNFKLENSRICQECQQSSSRAYKESGVRTLKSPFPAIQRL
jgi:hypothetical protein